MILSKMYYNSKILTSQTLLESHCQVLFSTAGMISMHNYKKETFRTRLVCTLGPTALLSVHFIQSIFSFTVISLGSIFLPGGQFTRNYSDCSGWRFFSHHVDLLMKLCWWLSMAGVYTCQTSPSPRHNFCGAEPLSQGKWRIHWWLCWTCQEHFY